VVHKAELAALTRQYTQFQPASYQPTFSNVSTFRRANKHQGHFV